VKPRIRNTENPAELGQEIQGYTRKSNAGEIQRDPEEIQ
jgi:hypothetical protein